MNAITCMAIIKTGPKIFRNGHIPLYRAKECRTAKYILVNKHTASATEGFAFALQQMHRATIVGDTTAGAGIAGSMIPLKENLVVFMPVKMVAAPGSEEGWEGKGVIPDVAVKGEDARTEAEKLIKKEQDDIAAAKTK
ncbi:S41 family peptidase [Chitinophaga pinensis]|nr:S41 family peptidase [Chitinophaga pinensis]